MYPNKEAQLKERFAKAFENMAREMKRSNDITLAKADHQQKTQSAMLAMVEPIIKNVLAGQRPPPPKRGRGKKSGKVISAGERFRNAQRRDS